MRIRLILKMLQYSQNGRLVKRILLNQILSDLYILNVEEPIKYNSDAITFLFRINFSVQKRYTQ